MSKSTKTKKKTEAKTQKSVDKTEEKEKVIPQQQEKINWEEKYVRLYADFENYKKRTTKNQLEWLRIANEQLIKDLIPIIEDLERALHTTNQKDQIAKKGIEMVYQKLLKKLAQQGLKPIEVEEGVSFNTEYHEALTTKPIEDEKLKGKVVEVITKGYLLNNKVIQVAKVITGI